MGRTRGDRRIMDRVRHVRSRSVLEAHALLSGRDRRSIGFLQAAWHFCATFGLVGVFNFGPNVGKTDTVEQAEFRRQDRRTAIQIIALSALAGAVAALAAYSLPV